jgi:hypothetical protein
MTKKPAPKVSKARAPSLRAKPAAASTLGGSKAKASRSSIGEIKPATAGPTEHVLTTADINRATLARQLLLQRTKLPVLDAIERLRAPRSSRSRRSSAWTRLAGFRRD